VSAVVLVLPEVCRSFEKGVTKEFRFETLKAQKGLLSSARAYIFIEMPLCSKISGFEENWQLLEGAWLRGGTPCPRTAF
jgi:hypothetical protein